MTKADKGRSLGAAAVAGVIWTFGAQWGMRLLGLGSTVVLARVLTPADFGLVAIAMAIYAMIDTVSNFSPQQYLIRAKTLEPHLLHTTFTLTFLRGVAVSLIVVAAAFLLPTLAGDPRIHGVALAIAALPVIMGLSNPRTIEFQREMDFSFAASRQLATKLIGVIVTVGVALVWRSHWALVLGLLAKEALWLPVSYIVKPYRPRLGFKGFRDLMGFSIWLSFESMITTLGLHIDRLFVAGFSNVKTVGAFAIGKDFSWILGGEFFATLDRVLFPTLSKLGDDPQQIRSGVTDIFTVLTAVTLPWIVGAALVGPDMIRLLYGPQWTLVAEIISPLILTMCFQGAATTARALAMACGKPRILAIRNAITVTTRVAVFVIGLNYFGIRMAVWMILPVALVTAIVNLRIINALSGVGALELLVGSRRSWVSVAVMAAAVMASAPLFPAPATPLLLALAVFGKAAIGTAVYASALFLLWHAAGRPAGAEQRLLAILAKITNRFRSKTA